MRSVRFILWTASGLLLAFFIGGFSESVLLAEEELQAGETPPDWTTMAKEWLDAYQTDLARLEQAQTKAYWQAANSGKKEDFDSFAEADLALKTLHAEGNRYEALCAIQANATGLDPMSRRALQVAALAFRANQLPQEILEQMVRTSAEIEQIFNTFRADLGGETLSNNELLERLSTERDSTKRMEIWGALKMVGTQVAPKLIELARVRNQAARRLGFTDYWDMQVRLQEHDPEQLLAMFDELEKLTNEPFCKMKHRMDRELARRFHIKAREMMPWHYDNPFFQDAPPSAKVDLNDFYKNRNKEGIVELARTFYTNIGLPADDVIARSDYYEREGKDQHAFCITMNRAEDVRTLLNVKPTADWMDTMLHETGHAVYYKFIDRSMPYNLREAAHIFTTEAVAMLFGAQAKNPTWLVDYAGAERRTVDKKKEAILEQRRREQLIFARWTMVMLHFERALYGDPDQDLNTLWWDLVERYQMLVRPSERNQPDWASKPHFTIAPVYYHNYMLGELFAAQLRATLAKMAGFEGPTSELSFKGHSDFGPFFIDKVFKPGMSIPWPAYVEQVTGVPLSPAAFSAEVQ